MIFEMAEIARDGQDPGEPRRLREIRDIGMEESLPVAVYKSVNLSLGDPVEKVA